MPNKVMTRTVVPFLPITSPFWGRGVTKAGYGYACEEVSSRVRSLRRKNVTFISVCCCRAKTCEPRLITKMVSVDSRVLLWPHGNSIGAVHCAVDAVPHLPPPGLAATPARIDDLEDQCITLSQFATHDNGPVFYNRTIILRSNSDSG